MPLTEPQVISYLVDHAWLDVGPVVDGDLMAIPETRRNSNLRITLGGKHRGFFVKQSPSGDAMNASFLHREAACYWLAQSHPELARLAAVQPRYFGFDPALGMLVVELVEPTETVGTHHFRTQEHAGTVARMLGELVAGYLGDSPAVAALGAGMLPRQDPWALTIAEQGTPVWLPSNQAVSFMIQSLRTHPGFAASLRDLREAWRTDHIIHGDVKFDNFLVSPDEEGAPARITLVDWELVGFGDGAWDVGSVFQEYLLWSIVRLPLQPDAPSADVAAHADEALAGVRGSISTFWASFRAASAAGGPTPDDEFLVHALACAGARLIQSCLEHAAFGGRLTPNLAAALQLAHNLLAEPAESVPVVMDA